MGADFFKNLVWKAAGFKLLSLDYSYSKQKYLEISTRLTYYLRLSTLLKASQNDAIASVKTPNMLVDRN